MPALVQAVEQTQKARRGQPLGRGVQQRDGAGLQAQLHVLRLLPIERGVEKSGIDPGLVQRAHLVVHQRNQGRDHDRHAMPGLLAHDGRHLVAQRFAATRGHEHQRVPTAHDMLDDGLLRPAKLRVAKDIVQNKLAGGHSRYSFFNSCLRLPDKG